MGTQMTYSVDIEGANGPFDFRYRKDFEDLDDAKRHADEKRAELPQDLGISIAIIEDDGVQDRLIWMNGTWQ